jgi:precorrin-2 dehydrogenase/sirohydrochlorin ferrochelatase
MPHTYPLMLDVADRLVVIVGGGAVAVRKACGLLHCGATRVRCVSPRFDPKMPDGVQRVNGRYEIRHLDGAALVFAATDDPDVNARVLHDARSRGIFANRADADETDPGDFATPARLHEGAVTVTVSAGGSPALAALIRNGIAAGWDARWSQMADAMQTLRPEILAKQAVSETRRRDAFRALATPDALDVVSRAGVDGLRTWLAERFPELNP